MTQATRTVQVEARPNPLTIDPVETAVIVVDMQNDFAAEGGMFARAGIPMSAAQAVVEPTAQVLTAARAVGMKVVYLKMAFESDLSNLGGPDAPNRVRHLAFGVGQPVETPDGGRGRFLIKDTWNTDILSELTPEPDDIVVEKHRYSGFFETTLDATLKGLGIKQLIFTGVTCSVCVESTLRDAFYRDYQCLLLADCTAEPIGSEFGRSNHEASLLVIEKLFGWVSDSASLMQALADEMSELSLQPAP
jgi:ureidoacrylate peracid hydrolase